MKHVAGFPDHKIGVRKWVKISENPFLSMVYSPVKYSFMARYIPVNKVSIRCPVYGMISPWITCYNHL